MAQDKSYPSDKGSLSGKGAGTEVARDFFGNPADGGGIRAAEQDSRGESPSNGHSRGHGAPPTEHESAALAIPARDPWMRLAVALILVGLTAYGLYANRQWSAIMRALVELKAAPRAVESHANVVERAEMSLGGPVGMLAELGVDSKTGDAAILLNFFNSGHTAARHFAVVAWTNARPGIPPIDYRQRFRNSATGEVSIRRMSAFETTVAAGSPDSVAVPGEWMPSSQWLADARANPDRLFVVSGVFEYCDVWGSYRCGNFSIRYLRPPAERFVSWLTTACRPDAPTPPESLAAATAPARWTPLERCEQPAEVGESGR